MTKYPTCRFYNERKFDQLTLCLWNSTVWILLILIFMFLRATTPYRLVFYVDRKYKNKKNRNSEKHFTKIEVYSGGNSEPTHSYPHFMITNVRPCLTYNVCRSDQLRAGPSQTHTQRWGKGDFYNLPIFNTYSRVIVLSFQSMKYTQSWIYTPDFQGKHFLWQSLREEILSYYLIFTGILKPIKKKKTDFLSRKGARKGIATPCS